MRETIIILIKSRETMMKYQLMRLNIQAIDTKQLNREIKCWCVKRNLH